MSQVKTVKIKHGNGFCIINATDFKVGEHELCEGETLGEDHQITVTISAETSPELQKTIDDAKAECEKVQAENVGLKQQIETFKSKQVKGEPADLSGLVPVEQFDAVAQKLTETEEQLGKAQEAIEQLAPENEKLKAEIASFTLSPEDQKLLLEKYESVKKERDALAAKVTSLESKLKKQTAAEAKAAKAAEESATADQPKE